MKRLIVVGITSAIFGAGWCLGQREAKPFPGGTAWNATSDSEKQRYIQGFKDGYTRGMSNTWASANAHQATDEKVLAELTAQKQRITADAWEGEIVFWPLHDSSPRVLSAAVSDFYDNQENLPVCWDRAVTLAAISLSPFGMKPTKQAELALATARKKGAEEGCR